MDQTQAPLFQALIGHIGKNPIPFHVPGHQSRAASGFGEAAAYFRSVYALDLTELPGLDDLHHAEGAIAQAQALAADCFGAERTWLLVGGSTVGNLCMIQALCAPDDLLIVQRNVHKSVINGLALAGARAVFLTPRCDERTGVPCGVRLDEMRAALETFPEAKGVLLTHPNYYGFGADLSAIAELVHAHGKALLVDEAHGAHCGFHPGLPQSAMQVGADAAVQSTHKLLTAMTMGAMLHVRGERLDRDKLQWYLSALQSSSPSYPILASLDLARRDFALSGRERIADTLRIIAGFHRALEAMPWFYCERRPSGAAFESRDPFKLVIHDRTGTLSGYRLLEALAARRCIAELADTRNVLLLFGLHARQADAEALLEALRDISGQNGLGGKELAPAITNNIYTNLHLSSYLEPIRLPRPGAPGAGGAETASVPWAEAENRIAAEMILPYPPGVPVLVPGERITAEAIGYIEAVSAAGARFQGANPPADRRIRVLAY